MELYPLCLLLCSQPGGPYLAYIALSYRYCCKDVRLEILLLQVLHWINTIYLKYLLTISFSPLALCKVLLCFVGCLS